MNRRFRRWTQIKDNKDGSSLLLLICEICVICGSILLPLSPARAAPPELWFYYATNLQVDANVDNLDPIWRRAAAAGYTKVLLADSKFCRLNDVPDRYFRNVARVRRLAADLHLDIVPAVFPVGYSNDLLYHDPNLAEGLPVKNALFTVHNNEAPLTPDPPVTLPSKPSWSDDAVHLNANTATVKDNPGNARFAYTLTVSPFRCYHVSVKIRTDHYTAHPETKAIADKQSLQYANLGVKPTQDWTEHHAVFNSLDHTKLTLYFGVWGRATGTLQWKDWKIEEIGLLNVLRRPGTPITVQGYTEGKDYDPIQDPHLGNHPYPGQYDVYHTPPVIHTHHLPDGTQLRVSWFHPLTIYDGQVAICLSDPKTLSLLADQAQRVKDTWGANAFMMSHDELRLANWDAACQSQHKDAGPLLADNVRACTQLLGPGARTYVWSDMFDPFHNAHADYYLVRGDLANSWLGLSPATTVVNWNFPHRDDSLKFFASRGHPQIIAAYYDGPLPQLTRWLTSADKLPPGSITGVMYTTWRNHYADLEAFARLVRAHHPH